MAYQARGRDPLFGSDMQAALEKRGKELIGIGLILVGLLFAAMIYSHTPEDPSFLSATDAPVQNWLGRPGASLSALLSVILGNGAWVLPLTILAWGGRLMMHHGLDRALGRLIFLPILIAVASVYAATLVPGEGWTMGYGLGGRFGDAILGFILTIVPFSMGFALKLMSLLSAGAMIALAVFVLGFTLPEVKRAGRFLMMGLVLSYAVLLALLGRGAKGALGAALTMQANRAERRAERVRQAEEDEWQVTDEDDFDFMTEEEAAAQHYAPDPTPEPEAKPSLLKRMPTLIRRAEPVEDVEMPGPELVPQGMAPDVEAPGEDRIKSKISDAIKSRVRSNPAVQVEAVAPLTKGRGRGPDPLVLNTDPHAQPAQAHGLRAEPPLTAGARVEPPLSAAMPSAAPMAAVPPVAAPHVDPAPHNIFAEGVPHEGMPAEAMMQAAPMATPEYPTAQPAYVETPVASEIPTEVPAAIAEIAASVGEVVEDAPQVAAPEPVAPAPRAIPTPEPRKVVQPLNRKPIQPSTRAKAEAQPGLQFDDKAPAYELPPLGLLANPAAIQRHHLSDEALEENARMLENVLDDYGVKGEIVSVRPGPVVTMYELEPAPGLKASRVIGLADDIARSMSALSARVSTVPGRSVIGIELPNENREKVVLREILAARDFGDGNQKLPLALGKDIGGDPVVANLAKMPHLLIAGTTGSGKSVAINTMILSLLYKLTPEECRLIMIDPKMLELSVYDGIPHLLSPVVTDPKKAVVALKWTVGEMEDRYRKMSKMGVRNIDGYNSRVEDALAKGETFSRTVQTGFDDETGEPVFETEEITPVKMPYIVVIVDEMADLMMVAGKEIEACIQRLAQMARASGIHLIMATQRPSVDVITGTIKANFPTRISFQVTSKVDSRTILGEMGAEQLLGMGDMLYMAGGAKITRCHGPFVSDEEVEEIVNHLKSYGPPDYIGGVVDGPEDDKADNIDAVLGLGGNTNGEDALYDQAVAIVAKDRKCSTSYIQRKLAIGYNKAARLVEQMEDEGVVSAANHVGKREVLVPEVG
ncbi:DNA translocase FtsK [Thalassovita mediterranea]|jgi:S-DNA-T family DNA segregation ATPase FtsK/SpoIIIE|uniref:DNA translocase FtsK n=1 Tax=Thalassovita mediterranea TaxID=340021 RepID=A0A0P1GRI5_9RHOB|nr:DNA translocase FtsK [Thalassovita mediterranea]CUH85138.1 DNA translocase FtsK [Thalassovita mediterranea]SIS30907.1 DNA translocase FtsK [Thalassovita mediterranea]